MAILIVAYFMVNRAATDARAEPGSPPAPVAGLHRERVDDPWRAREMGSTAGGIEHCGPWVRDGFVSVQVNVDAKGCNIVGDAANEPSIAVVATDPSKIVIGFRQFDTVLSNFRQAGYAYSHDAGTTWTFPGVLEPGVFRTDPVLGTDADGNVFYLSMVSDAGISFVFCDLWKSADAGASWDEPVYAYGGDKAWFAIDQTDGPGRGNMYQAWDRYSCCGHQTFARSKDNGATFEPPQTLPRTPEFGTVAVGLYGEVYISGVTSKLLQSWNARDSNTMPYFSDLGDVELGGSWDGWTGPNPGGLLGQSWVAADHSAGTFRGWVYMLGSVAPYDDSDPLDVMFARSSSHGARWTRPRRINDDPYGNFAYQWFGTLSVAPNGRIDAIWNDTRNGPDYRYSELYYAASVDAGRTWTPNVAVGPAFNSWLGWPNQQKIGDYYHTVSDRDGVHVAYAATFNGEQDVYYLRIPADCNANGIADSVEIEGGAVPDQNGDAIPDVCQGDQDHDGVFDIDDPDVDGDQVPNGSDRCVFGPVGCRVRPDGSCFGDFDEDCFIDLTDHHAWEAEIQCFSTGGPGVSPSNRRCGSGLDFDADGDVDLRDVADYQRIFGWSGE